jgi:hypothetical protein
MLWRPEGSGPSLRDQPTPIGVKVGSLLYRLRGIITTAQSRRYNGRVCDISKSAGRSGEFALREPNGRFRLKSVSDAYWSEENEGKYKRIVTVDLPPGMPLRPGQNNRSHRRFLGNGR